MDIGKSHSMDEIYRAIGHAVSRLIASGTPVQTENILAQLKQSEAHSVDGTKKIYAEAIRFVAEGMNRPFPEQSA